MLTINTKRQILDKVAIKWIINMKNQLLSMIGCAFITGIPRN